MPKIIPNVKGRVLGYVKEQLLAGKSRSLSIIDIANACQIATGTVFNYFESKDMIFATIILEDWNVTLSKMQENSKTATDFIGGIDGIYSALSEFVNTYRAAWKDYTNNGELMNILREHHVTLREQISKIILSLPMPECKDPKILSMIIAEDLLWLVKDEQISYEACKETVLSLLQK